MEMLKMLTLRRMSRSKSVPARDCQLSPVMISGGWFAKAAIPLKTYFGEPGVKSAISLL